MAKSNYKKLPISKLTLEGSGINIDQLKIFKALNERQDRIIEKLLKKRNLKIFSSVKGMQKDIRRIDKRLSEGNREFQILDMRIKRTNTILWIVAIIVGIIGIGFLGHLIF